VFKIIYELNGSQYLTEVSESGGICSDAVIIWDERKDGEIYPGLIQYVGCLRSDGETLSVDFDRQDEIIAARALEENALVSLEADKSNCQIAFNNIETASTIADLKKCIKHIAYTIGVI